MALNLVGELRSTEWRLVDDPGDGSDARRGGHSAANASERAHAARVGASETAEGGEGCIVLQIDQVLALARGGAEEAAEAMRTC